MSDSNTDNALNKATSRRSVLKWTGALAAAGIVGIGLGFGGELLTRPSTTKTSTTTVTSSAPAQTTTVTGVGTTQTTTVTAPPPTLSYVPPLSPEVQTRVDAIVQSLVAQRVNDTVVRASRYAFWSGADMAGMMRVHVNGGVVTGIEMDDTINAGVPREDLNWSNVSQGLIQARGAGGGAPRTFSYRRYMYRPQRLLYPMMRTGPRGDPYNANFVRITWAQAISTIATQMQQAISKYGPYSIAAWYTGSLPEAAYLNAGCTGWGIASDESTNFATNYVYGATNTSGSEVTDMFNSKLIILWGSAATQTPLSAEVGYFIKLAKEKYSIPVIAIDYRYTKDVGVLADQWIPIRPGTDSAMMLAIAYQLFSNNLYNTSYVSKFVEPTGFQTWQNYVLGKVDGVAKTPQWQESITGVPAQTVIDLANLYAKSSPTYLIASWATGRQVHGENYTRAAIYLQAMMGYIGVAGGNSANNQGGQMRSTSKPTSVGNTLFGGTAASYATPVLFKNYKWADAVLLKSQYDSGALTQQDYYDTIGNPMSNPAPNIQFIWFNTNLLNQTNNINKQIQAVQAATFAVASVWYMDQPTGLVSDIVLPRAEVFEEDPTIVSWGVSGFELAPKIVQPQGDVKSMFWIHVQLAKGLGIVQQYAPQLANVTDADWDETMMTALEGSYNSWATANKVTTTWSEFLNNPVYRVPITSPQMVQYSSQIQGGQPFLTASGKIEFNSSYLAQGDTFLETTKYGGHLDPYATYVNIAQGFFDSNVSTYPLMCMSPHSRYRLHSWGDGDPMLNTDAYRHSVWISVADAQARGIVDGDTVKVFNAIGTINLPAYVTSKIVPGTVLIFEGGWAAINSSGVDTRGAPNSITVDTANPDGQWPFHALVDVQKQ